MTILIIDDSMFLQLEIQKVLQQVGHRTLLATDGEQAINLAVEKCPDLILFLLKRKNTSRDEFPYDEAVVGLYCHPNSFRQQALPAGPPPIQ
jgi:hypothetical protein